FFHDEKVSKKSRQNYASSRSNAIQKLLQKLGKPLLRNFKSCIIHALLARSFASLTHKKN
ncbi:MAG TPA: hypothetical protein PLH91_07995, partial [Tenuifilaceae bacterium]|nr:hypothetical protein [Tenuifilaceae bacterium]